MIFLCYSRCSTCQKAKKWLDEKGVSYDERPIKEKNPSIDEIKVWHKKSGLSLKRFFNTSGNLYKDMKLKDKLINMSEEDQYKLLATNGMLVKRPILVSEEFILVGFKENEWKEKVK